MQNPEKTKQFVSELRSLLFKHEIRLICSEGKLYFENEDMDIKVEVNEELNNEIFEESEIIINLGGYSQNIEFSKQKIIHY